MKYGCILCHSNWNIQDINNSRQFEYHRILYEVMLCTMSLWCFLINTFNLDFYTIILKPTVALIESNCQKVNKTFSKSIRSNTEQNSWQMNHWLDCECELKRTLFCIEHIYKNSYVRDVITILCCKTYVSDDCERAKCIYGWGIWVECMSWCVNVSSSEVEKFAFVIFIKINISEGNINFFPLNLQTFSIVYFIFPLIQSH